MKSYLQIKNKKIHYSDEGEGASLVFLHGYLESLEIWNDFINDLKKFYRVICFDIPGHGKSQILGEQHSIEQLAEVIYLALKKLGIGKCFMIGHSMGGYITLMFQKLYAEMLTGFSLFHSHPFADSKQVVEKRLREIELVKKGKKEIIASLNIPNAFAGFNLVKLKNEIEYAKNIALNTPGKGIIANLHAMMKRPDLTDSLKHSELPFFYVLGKHDNYIDYQKIVSEVALPGNSERCILEKSGHMGFFEERGELTNRLKTYLK